MKSVLLSALCLSLSFFCGAQTVNELPAGQYETKTKTSPNKWEKGDLILLDESHYKMAASGETGEYRFSVAAQRIFFTSGPLKSAFTKVNLVNGKAVIVLPVEQNAGLGITTEVWASRQ